MERMCKVFNVVVMRRIDARGHALCTRSSAKPHQDNFHDRDHYMIYVHVCSAGPVDDTWMRRPSRLHVERLLAIYYCLLNTASFAPFPLAKHARYIIEPRLPINLHFTPASTPSDFTFNRPFLNLPQALSPASPATQRPAACPPFHPTPHFPNASPMLRNPH